MNIRIVNSKTKHEQIAINNQFVLEENQKYIVHHKNFEFTEEDFKFIGTYVSPEHGLLQSTNKIGVFRLKEILIRFRSKLGDDFFEKIKEEIAEIEKLLLLSSNSIEDQFSLSYGGYLEETALSVFLDAWNKGTVNKALRAIFEKPNFGFIDKLISKNLSHGGVLSEIDFEYLNRGNIQLGRKNNKLVPMVFLTAEKYQTNNILEMRFIKVFLFFCLNLLERNATSKLKNLNELKNKLYDLTEESERNDSLKIKDINELVMKSSNEYKAIKTIKLHLNKFYKNTVLNDVIFDEEIDFTSLKLHNNFHYKYLLQLFLKMRKSFNTLSNNDLVHLDINSLENLYEYYCLIKIIKSFEIQPAALKKLIKKDSAGWVIDKSVPLDLGSFKDKKLILFFKKNYIGLVDTYSQDYSPDYTIQIQDTFGNVDYLHLDAKYKHNNFNVKKEDIDKMHTYTHSIKSTKAAIVLFPGKKEVYYKCEDSIVGAVPCYPKTDVNLKEKILKMLNVD